MAAMLHRVHKSATVILERELISKIGTTRHWRVLAIPLLFWVGKYAGFRQDEPEKTQTNMWHCNIVSSSKTPFTMLHPVPSKCFGQFLSDQAALVLNFAPPLEAR